MNFVLFAHETPVHFKNRTDFDLLEQAVQYTLHIQTIRDKRDSSPKK